MVPTLGLSRLNYKMHTASPAAVIPNAAAQGLSPSLHTLPHARKPASHWLSGASCKAVLTFPLTSKRCFPRCSMPCSFTAENSCLCSTELLAKAAADLREGITPCIQPHHYYNPRASECLGTWKKSLARIINTLFEMAFEF